MGEEAIVIRAGEGRPVGNVEFLARTADAPRFNLAVVEMAAGRELEAHVHEAEDDSFYVLDGEVTSSSRPAR